MKQNQILRSPDPLDFNIEDIDTSRPRVPEGLYELIIDDPKLEKTKDGKGEMLTFVLKSTKPLTSTSGETLSNFSLKHRMSLTPTEKFPVESVKKNLASLFKTAGMSGSGKAIINSPTMLSGKVVTAKLKIRKETSEFPESNEVQYFVEPSK